MARCDRGVQSLLVLAGAVAAFGLMSVAVGTDYWLYSRAYVCNGTNGTAEEDVRAQSRGARGDLTHSGLWRVCCMEGINKGSCFRINHFPEDNNYDTDRSDTALLLVGGLCVGVSRAYNRRNAILLSAGILFVAAGLSNIIGIIVYISSNAGDPSDKKDEERKSHYSYGWSFYSGALSFIAAELVGVLAVHIYIERNKDSRFRSSSSSCSSASCRSSHGRDFIKATASSSSPYARIPSYRYRRRRSRSSSTNPSREPSPVGRKGAKVAAVSGEGGAAGGGGLGLGLPMGDISMYTLSSRDSTVKGLAGTLGPYCFQERDAGFLQVHNCFQKDQTAGNNRRTTPV
ncbi:hypothetical protein CRUP_007528 [Coryphaenoides rupestris]|nr:hypothetical protein CRUP_007528 [Coryphaenoides rupestris]